MMRLVAINVGLIAIMTTSTERLDMAQKSMAKLPSASCQNGE